jgi:hypothetical protein
MNATTTRPDLADHEVDALCGGLRQNAAKVRYLMGLGLTVNTRPNGRPLVWRAHAEQVLSGIATKTAANDSTTPAPTGNRAGMLLMFGRRAA